MPGGFKLFQTELCQSIYPPGGFELFLAIPELYFCITNLYIELLIFIPPGGSLELPLVNSDGLFLPW